MRRGRGPAIVVALVLMTMVPVTRADEGRSTDLALMDLPDAAQPQIDDPISEAELEDLTTIADQKGMSLQAAIDRYAWNDNFALAMATVRQSSPEAFTGAEIVDGGTAWVAFAARPRQGHGDYRQVHESPRHGHGGCAFGLRVHGSRA